MNKGKSYLKLFALLAFGGLLGGAISMIIFWGYDDLLNVARGADGFFRQTGMWIETVVVLGFSIAVTGIYLYVRRVWKKEQGAEDEQADVYGERFEIWSQVGVVIADVAAGCMIILGFVFLPRHSQSIDVTWAWNLLSITFVMLAGAIYMAILEIMYYHLIQKRDPKKKGDPASFSFNKKWLASCDETEKLVIYQAGYKGFQSMQILLVVGIVMAGIGKLEFNTGNFPILLMGCIWLAGNISFGIRKMKGLKK